MADTLDALIALARESSSEKRRELLRGATDMFFAAPDASRAANSRVFDAVLSGLAAEMEAEVRAELAQRLAPAEHAPGGVVLKLASDEIAVAAPLLTRSRALGPEALLRLARDKGQEHLRCLSGRDDLTEAVSEVIVERGDATTLGVLLRNADAPLSRAAAEQVVDRAQAEPRLHAAVIDRAGLPADLLNEMYFVVEQRLRERIAARNARLQPAELEAALTASRRRLATRDGVLPPDFDDAERDVEAMLGRKGSIEPASLVGFLRNGHRTRFLVALARVADMDFDTVRRIVERQDLDALTLVCRASGYDAALFTTLALLLSEDRAAARVQDYRRRYDDLPLETAQRTLRFWRMRRGVDQAAA